MIVAAKKLKVLFAGALLFAIASDSVYGEASRGDSDQQRLGAMQTEIRRLRGELQRLAAQERGVLGELERLAAELRLREAELREISARLEATEDAIRAGSARLAELDGEQQKTRGYLEFRLREIYKRGSAQRLRQWIGGRAMENYLRGLGYASWLSERDARALQAYRDQTRQLKEQTDLLIAERDRLAAIREESVRVRRRLTRSRLERSRLLAEIRQDQSKRQEALAELESASRELNRLVRGLETETATPRLDVLKFRGLLDTPADGKVTAEFGKVVHPRFRTEVPHPGWDLDAPAGSDFRSVFDGTVLFASWLRGYGLTVIVDHGGGLISVYAHAWALLVEKGEEVARGQSLGKVGDTGSLRGPYLYFELRLDGSPVDPAEWLRRPGP